MKILKSYSLVGTYQGSRSYEESLERYSRFIERYAEMTHLPVDQLLVDFLNQRNSYSLFEIADVPANNPEAKSRFQELLEYVHAERRVCPARDAWVGLWSLLTEGPPPAGCSHPSPPPTQHNLDTAPEKRLQMSFFLHLYHALKCSKLEVIDGFIRNLKPGQWRYRV